MVRFILIANPREPLFEYKSIPAYNFKWHILNNALCAMMASGSPDNAQKGKQPRPINYPANIFEK